MELKTYFAQDASGNIMPGATVTVYEAGTATLATGLQDESGSPLANPFTADSSAKVAFYAPDGLYDITVVGNGRTVTILAQFVSVDEAGVLRGDLAAPGGAALVGYDGGTAQDVLDDAKPMASYTALRAHTGRATGVRITQTGLAGFFQRDDADTISADNGGTVIVDAGGRRWKRLFVGPVNVGWFGAVGNGVTDDTAAIQAASTAALNASVYFPSGNYKITSKITTLPYGQKWMGDGRYSSVIVKYFNGDMVDMGTACTFDDLGFSGQGSTYSGRGVVISGVGNTRQVLRNCNITNMSGYCLEITTPNAGAGLDINGGNYVRTDETLSAIRLPVDSAASPRFIRSVDTTGFMVDTNGADNTILTGNRARNIVVGSSSNKVIANGNRFSSLGLPLVVEGTQHSFTGNVLAGDLTLGASANGCIATSNVFASPFGVVDNGIAAGNIFDVAATTYTPVWTSTGTPPALGNGTIRGAVTKAGQSVTVNVSLLMGSTTTFGTDDWTFSLPFASNSVLSANNYGIAYFFDSGTAYKIGIVRNIPGTSVVRVFYDDAPGAVRSSRPFVWAAGDELSFSITYIC